MKVYCYNFWPKGDKGGVGGFEWSHNEADRDKALLGHLMYQGRLWDGVESSHWGTFEWETELTDSAAITAEIDENLFQFEVDYTYVNPECKHQWVPQVEHPTQCPKCRLIQGDE